ncbi:MAG: hypothetical protein WBW78_08375, partial [Terrimicrobiaceae bacterium]
SSIVKTVTDEASFGSQMETRRVDCVEVAMSGDGFDGVVALAARSSETQAVGRTAAPGPRSRDSRTSFLDCERLASVGNAQLAGQTRTARQVYRMMFSGCALRHARGMFAGMLPEERGAL